MSDHDLIHPSAEELIEFVEGRLADATAVEAHIDVCRDCAKAILTARQLRLLTEQNLIPPLSVEEREREKARLRKLFQSGGGGSSSGNPKDSVSPAKPNTTFLSGLGAIGAAWGMSHTGAGAKPLLASRDDSESPPPGSTKPAGHADGDSKNSENSELEVVTDPDDPASTQQKGSNHGSDEIAKMLDRMEKTLGTSRDGTENSGETDDGMIRDEFGVQADPEDDHADHWNDGGDPFETSPFENFDETTSDDNTDDVDDPQDDGTV